MKRTTMAMLAVTLAVLVGTTAKAGDEQIATQIIQRLKQRQQASKLEGFNIGVQVEQGTVTVMGTVSQSDDALMALDVARRVPGVKLVVNDLFVQPSTIAGKPQPKRVIAQASETTELVKSPAISAPSSTPIDGLDVANSEPPAAPKATVPTAMPPATAVTAATATTPSTSTPSPMAEGTFWGAPMPATQAVPKQPIPPTAAPPQMASMPRQAAHSLAPQQPQQAAVSRASAQNAGPTGSGIRAGKPIAFAPARGIAAHQASFNAAPEYMQAAPAQYGYASAGAGPSPVAIGVPGGGGVSQASYDNPQMPGYAWPSYAAYPNYAALTYPHQYSATAWPYIGPFYPYPQVPLGWRKVSLEWDDGWWFLDFKSKTKH